MALSPCTLAVDENGRELTDHGSASFPIACYHDDLSVCDVPWHWHEEMEAGIITEGSAILTIGREEYALNAGDGFFINSGVLHGAYPAANSCRIHSLVFHSSLVGGHPGSIFYQNYLNPLQADPTLDWVPFSPDVPEQYEALASIEAAWKCCSEEPSGHEFLVRDALSRLIYLLCANHKGTAVHQNSKSVRDCLRIKQMLTCIHSHFDTGLTISDIAAAASISESECLRCFRATIGTTPIQYLKQYRLRQASKLLLSSDSSVSDIAYQCGFQDMSYFTRVFRQARGSTPTQYRKEKSSY